MKSKFKKIYKYYLKITLIIIGVLIGVILLDTLQARIFKHNPIISWKENLEDDDSYVYRGILIDTYYCTKEKDIMTISWHFKGNKFTCSIDDAEEDSERKQNLVSLLKEKMIEQEILDEDNLETFEVIYISEYGYYRDTPEKKYMQFNFQYSCKDGTNECFIYDDYAIIWAYTDEKEIYELSKGVSININDDFEFLNSEIK